MQSKYEKAKKMRKKGLKRRVVAGVLALSVFGASFGLPATMQTGYAEGVGLPTETNISFSKAREIEFGTSIAGTVSEIVKLR